MQIIHLNTLHLSGMTDAFSFCAFAGFIPASLLSNSIFQILLILSAQRNLVLMNGHLTGFQLLNQVYIHNEGFVASYKLRRQFMQRCGKRDAFHCDASCYKVFHIISVTFYMGDMIRVHQPFRMTILNRNLLIGFVP